MRADGEGRPLHSIPPLRAVGLASALGGTLPVHSAQLFMNREFKLKKYWWGQLCLSPKVGS